MVALDKIKYSPVSFKICKYCLKGYTYSTRILGYTIIRITHKEYIKKTKYDLVCKLLNIEIGPPCLN